MKTHYRRLTGTLLLTVMLMSLTTYLSPLVSANATDRSFGFYDQTYEINGASRSYSQGVQSSSSSGAFTYSLPLALPPGRSSFTPSLSLNYNSQARDLDSFFGYGWSMDFPSITRLNKTGIDRFYTDNYFSSSLSGELVATTSTGYATKIEGGDFLTYNYTGTSWTATDKSGKVYTFGSSSTARQTDPSDTTHVYKWLLEEIRDANDNTIEYEYTQDNGQVYPSRITYTGSGSTEGPFAVDFTLEARTDSTNSYQSGFEVDTNNRVAGINVSFNGTLIHEYALSYTTPDNSQRSLLASVQESAWDNSGTETTLPATTFTYADSAKGWTETSGYNIPVYFYQNSSNEDKGVDFADVNGDGLIDILDSGLYSSSSTINKVYLNQGDGTGWAQDTGYSIPTPFWSYGGSLMKNTRLTDVNGDGFSDIFFGSETDSPYKKVYKANESGKTWLEDSSYTMPLSFNNGYSNDQGVRLLDINGDGFPDFVQSLYGSSSYQKAYLFDPETKTWIQDTGISIPVYFDDPNGYNDEGVELADVNGDGLVDLIESKHDGSSYQGVYINQGDGSGWVKDTNYSIPVYFWDHSGTMMNQVQIVDMDGDGLGDLVESYYDSGSYDHIYINRGDGTGWTLDSAYSVPVYFTNGYSDYEGVQLLDADGDGFPDLVQSKSDSSGSTQKVYLNNATPELLTGIETSKGSSTSVDYAPSTASTNPTLPFNMTLVAGTTTDDGLGNTATTTYSYEDGAYFYQDELNRQFAGFGTVTKTENVRTTKTYYNQDSLAKIGHPYQTDVYDNSGNLYQRTLDDWETTALGYDNTFIYKAQTVSLTYDGSSSHRDRATTMTYDPDNGNVLESTDYGEVSAATDGTFTDTGSDDVTQTFTYASDSYGVLQNKPSSATVSDSSGTTVSETKYFYDDLGYGSVNTGNLTSKETWLDTNGSWVTESYTVDGYGLTDSVTDARGNTTHMSYDSEHMYVATLTNALGQSTTSTYEYRNGKPATVTNANGFTSETTYDGLGRPTANYSPDPTTGTTTLVSSTSYDDASFPSRVTTTSSVDGISTESRQYFDGLGRTIQSWSSAESGFSWSDTWYDDLGNVEQQSFPYASSGSVYTGRDSTQPASTTTYDALNRPLVQSAPAGDTSNDYDHWTQTITDPNGNTAVHYADAFGHLVQVDEHVDSATNSTTYDYDALGRMIKLTDPNGNVRHFTYDSLGRQTSQEDLHAASSGSFGTWTYTYDANGNRLSQTDPMSQVISWDYDALNRATAEDWNDDGTNDVSTTYDTATNGIGMPATVTMSAWSDTYSYDAQGHVSTETKTIDSTAYTTESTYDLLGRLKEVLYPNSAMTVNYTYNSAGQVESITKDGTNVLSNVDYSPAGQVTQLDYGNGVSTTNTYDPNQNNRLVNKITTGTYDETMLTDADGDGLYGYEEIALSTDPNNPDTDGDQLKDGDEATFSDNPLIADTDSDGILDGNEDADGDGLINASELYSYFTDPFNLDTDGDGRGDYAELLGSPTSNPLIADTDSDGLGDNAEITCSANPNMADTDSDGLGDYAECITYTTNPNSLDTDSDGLGDYREIFTTTTNPKVSDTDGDALGDGAEIMSCYSNPHVADTDHDGLSDYSECITYHTNPKVSDTDGDGLADYPEVITFHSNPLVRDTDGDGLGDYAEAITYHSNPRVGDTDGEGLGDYAECITFHTNPNKKDTDGDGYSDFYEVTHSRNPLDPLALSTFDKLVGYLVPSASASTGDIQDLTYTYDADGNITNLDDTSITPTAKSMTYAYDELNRLTSASSSGLAAGDYSQSYSYDALGNLTSKSDVGTLTYSGSGYPNPHAVTDVAGTAYTYDLNGNLTSDGTHSYTWNIKNQLASSGSQTFSYNPSGSRYKTVDGTDTTIYVNSYLEVRPEGATYYIFNGSQRIASVKDSTITYYSQDHLGGTALATNSTGTVVEVDDYYPYGDSLASINEGSDPVHHTFTDKEFDDSLGLFYFEARWYNPTIGRFVSEDPMQLDGGMMKLLGDPQSLNFYTYTRNNPVNLTDPTGRGWLDGVSNFISGVSNAVGSNNIFGAGRESSSNSNFNAGQTLGDAISFGIGLAETVAGLAVASVGGGGGLVLAPATGGTSAIAGADAVVAGATLATYGTTVMASAGNNLVNDAKKLDGPHSLPIEGEPNSTNLKWENGVIDQARTYDENGNPSVDYDFNDHNNSSSNPHYHEWTQNPDTGKFERGTDHIELNSTQNGQ